MKTDDERRPVGPDDVVHESRVRHDPVHVNGVISLLAKSLGNERSQSVSHKRRESVHAAAQTHIGLEALRIAPPAPCVRRRIAIRKKSDGLARWPTQLGMMGQYDVDVVATCVHTARD